MLVLLVSCVIVKVCSSSGLTCEKNWIEYRGKCYYFSEKHEDTRDQAVEFCRTEGSHLVSVTDAETNDFLFSKRKHNDHYWIGLKTFPGNSWGWSDGTTDNGITWGGNPVSGQACAYYVNNNFYEYECNRTILWSLCERDTKPSSAQDWIEYDGHWYRAIEENVSQLSAARTCVSYGGYLTRVTSNDEKLFVSRNTQSTNVWTGLTRLVWDDGSGYNWHAFPDSEEDSPTDSSCTALGKGGSKTWKTSGCGGWNKFICAHALLTTTNQPTITISEPTKATTSTKFTTITTRTTSTNAPSTTTSMTTPSTNPATTQTSSVTSTKKAIERSTTLTSTHQPTKHRTGQTQKTLTSSSNTPFYETSEATSTTDTSSQLTSERFEELNSPEDGALLYVMCVIYALIAVMLAIDLVLLGVFLKLRKNSMNNFDDISPGLYENTLMNSKTEVQSQYGADLQAHAADPFPIYAMPTKPQTKPKPTATRLNRTSDQDEKGDLSSDITGRNTNVPVYAVPSKRRSHDPDL